MNARPSLGAFLRSRRERVTPGDVGMPKGGRRRTPGLRREELAVLAGISADYLVRLEQDRDRRPSTAVLASLCAALRLDGDERAHMLRLAGLDAQRDMCPAAAQSDPVGVSTVALLDELDTTPALVLERSAHIAARNRTYEALMRCTGLFDLEPPNLARFVFLSPRARSLYRDWTTSAGEVVADLHAAAAACARDEALEALVGELLLKSAEFATLWARHDVSTGRRSLGRMQHPDIGPVDFDVEVLFLAGCSGRRFVTYLPADQSTAVAIECLVMASSTAACREDP